MTDDFTIEAMAAQSYVDYWEGKPDGDKYDKYESRFEELRSYLMKDDAANVLVLMRESYAHAYKQGFLFRLTGE